MSKWNQVVYQIYPLGFCGAPRENDMRLEHRILRVKEWIPHFRKLGITSVLFNPVFESDRHGYDTRDFSRIDCRLGTNEDFREVCDALHDAGISVILDGVFNHVGRGFRQFQDVIINKENSRYKDWFHINFHDHNQRDGFWYEGWEGHQELVKLNMNNDIVRRYLIERADQWIAEFGIDGLRLDVAYMVDKRFMHELCDHIRSYDPDFFFVGEMIGGDYNAIMKDNLMDSVTNYECRKGIFSSMNSSNMFEIAYSLNRQFGNDPWTLYHGRHLLTFLDNHDVDRIASTLTDARDLPLVYALMTAMPGIPCIYYGSEWGAKAKRTKFSDNALRPEYKRPMFNDLSEYIAKLNEMRTSYSVFSEGDYVQIHVQNKQLVFRRRNSRGQLTFAINIDSSPVHIRCNPEVERGIDLITKKKVTFEDGIHLDAKSVCFVYSDWL